MRHIMIATTLLWLAIGTAAAAREKADPLPDAKQVKTISIKFDHPELNDVEFTATTEDWQAIRASLLPARRDKNPAKWEGIGRVQIVKTNGQPFRVELYATSKDPGAFAAGQTIERRVYYRGGKTAQLLKALVSAYDKSQKRDKN